MSSQSWSFTSHSTARVILGLVLSIVTCHLGWMHARCMQHDSCDTGFGHIKILLNSVLPLSQV